MSSSFHNADQRTHRKVLLMGLMFCAVFAAITFFVKQQPDNTYVVRKANRLVRNAGSILPAN